MLVDIRTLIHRETDQRGFRKQGNVPLLDRKSNLRVKRIKRFVMNCEDVVNPDCRRSVVYSKMNSEILAVSVITM